MGFRKVKGSSKKYSCAIKYVVYHFFEVYIEKKMLRIKIKNDQYAQFFFSSNQF